MGNTPSVFEQTPQEHALATARYMEKQREIAVWPPETAVPPGHVRIQFYAYRYKVRDGFRPDMESVLPLEKSGALSLFAVRRRWGLETCSIIDPPEMKLGFSADPNWLPAGVVKDLVARHGCIKLIEPYASYETLIKRELRHVALACTSVLYSWAILARDGAKHDYRTMRQRLSEPMYVSASCYFDWSRAANLAVLLIVLLLIFASTRDIDLGLMRLGDAMVNTVAASAWMSFGVWASLAVLFFVAPEAHVKALGLEDGKLMLVLCA
ncbi:hypothetical protein B0H17DRAFT_1148951 [Mycena rosella]|uniref:Uncharacterized protein n=1 Tax=Mycena rosella TaxID=1033263 RepID=A0AAD7FSB2_MYCRO|nr:hypothetical protein B0H17DRAFT_1148951 [Mycena rosella]